MIEIKLKNGVIYSFGNSFIKDRILKMFVSKNCFHNSGCLDCPFNDSKANCTMDGFSSVYSLPIISIKKDGKELLKTQRTEFEKMQSKIKSLESELEQAKKELNLAKKVRSHLDQICDGTHEEVSCLIKIENDRLEKENQELAAQHCSSAVLDEHGNRRCSQTGELI